MDADEALKQIATYEYGQSRKGLIAVADDMRRSHNNPERRNHLRKELSALLNANATADCKQFVCEQLSIIGAGEEVPTLAKLLTDEKLSDAARIALERIPDSAADAVLRDALGKTKGKTLVGVINSLGVRRNNESVGVLIKLISDPDDAVAGAACAALGKIGGPEAVSALARARSKASPRLRPTVVDALLRCAERSLREGKKDEATAIYRDLSAPGEARHVREAASRGLESARAR